MESASRCCAKPCTALPFGLVSVPEIPRMPERSSVAVMMSVVSPPSCTCGGSKAIEMSCGGVVSEFGSTGPVVPVPLFGLLLPEGACGDVPADALDPPNGLAAGWTTFGVTGCGFTGAGAGGTDLTWTTGEGVLAGPAGTPRASNSRKRWARADEAADEVVAEADDVFAAVDPVVPSA